jgi:hypothetical protein
MFNRLMFVFSKGCPLIFAARIGIVSYSICKTLQRKKTKQKDFLFTNCRLAANMLPLQLSIYTLKKQNNAFPAQDFI